MAAENIWLSTDLESEFNPKVFIFADEPQRYEGYAAHLIKNGFPCEVHQAPPDGQMKGQRPGTIFFVSFNLTQAESTSLARFIEQNLHMVCIVFAELTGVENAAKLSSAKMTQTLQHPYTEKNFLMAVQTIVKKRKVQHEKNMRRNAVHERRRNSTEPAASPPQQGPDEIRFTSQPQQTDDEDPVAVQIAQRAVASSTERFSGSAHSADTGPLAPIIEDRLLGESFMHLQKGLAATKFLYIPQPSRGSKPRYHLNHGRSVLDLTMVSGHSPQLEVVRVSAKLPGQDSESLAATGLGERKTPASRGAGEVQPSLSTKILSVEGLERALKAIKSSIDAVGLDIFFAKESVSMVGGEEETQKKKVEEPASINTSEPFKQKTRVTESLVVPTWVLIVSLSLGIVMCLFFLFFLVIGQR